MAEVIFTHPYVSAKMGDLGISVKPDQVTWAYGLNTQSYPTYGGEVVQILSVYFDDMTIAGTVSKVAEVERIYAWFILYMQSATQGRTRPGFDQRPVTFSYPERQWTFDIWPRSLPGFQLSREIVAPTWTLVAAVKEPDADFAQQLRDLATFNAQKGNLATFGKTTADFGNTGDLTANPFASPDANPSSKGQTMAQFLSKTATQYADSFNGFIQSWQNSDWTKLPQFSSGPAAAPSPKAKPGVAQKKASKVQKTKTPFGQASPQTAGQAGKVRIPAR